ncbi:MAG: TerB family tellurite resistance protein [Pseudomonadota bacterium]
MQLLSGAEPVEPEALTDAARVALGALLVEAAKADGVYLDAERTTIVQVLASRYELSAAEAEALCIKAEQAQSEAVDLVRFTRAIKDAVPFEDRVGVVEALWQVIYADEDRDHRESALVRKLAGLLYVPDREAGLARQRVTGES